MNPYDAIVVILVYIAIVLSIIAARLGQIVEKFAPMKEEDYPHYPHN